MALVIFVLDLPAIILTALLWFPFFLFAEDETTFFYGMFYTSFFTITFQWLIIGKAIYNTFSSEESKLISLALNDE